MSDKERQKKEYIEVKKLFIDFLTWLKKPNPETTLVNCWTRKLEAKRQTKEYKQKVAEQAYLLWEADGKPEGKDKYYWKLAIDKIEGKNIPIIYRPYYLLEKRILEPSDAWISRQAFFAILGRLGNLALIVAVISFVFGEKIRRNNEIFAAWQTITSAHKQPGSGGRIQALQFLNSRPLRFPWIVGLTKGFRFPWITFVTEKDWYWNGQKCEKKGLWGFRWERQSLVGLSAPSNAYLAGIHLCGAELWDANLEGANLRDADLKGAELWDANLEGANLRDADLQGAKLGGADLQGAFLLEADLQGANLGHADLQGAVLWRAELQRADLRDAELQGVDLRDTDLQGVGLRGADLQGVDLRGADLQGVDLRDTDLQEAKLGLADLQRAKLGGADLKRANLGGADLRGAFLWEADLQGANLWDANLKFKQIKLACFWEQAIYTGASWNKTEEKWIVVDEEANQREIEAMNRDQASEPVKPPDCRKWK